MRYAVIFLIALCAATLSAEPSNEQMEMALATWRQYDMPEPPEDAPLVILESSSLTYVNGARQPAQRRLVFKLSEVVDGEPRYFVGAGVATSSYGYSERPAVRIDDIRVNELELGGFTPSDAPFGVNHAFALGLHLWARQHRALGRAVMEQALELHTGDGLWSQFQQQPKDSPAAMLPYVIWTVSANRLVTKETDRQRILEAMKQAINEFEALTSIAGLAESRRELVRQLEATLAESAPVGDPWRAKIDALTDLCARFNLGGGLSAKEDLPDAYEGLLLGGFDGVPTMLEHLEDPRLTRSVTLGMMNASTRIMTVGEVVRLILEAIAGRDFQTKYNEEEKSWELDRDDINAWWNSANADGERNYFTRQVFKHESSNSQSWPDSTALRILAAKWPSSLPPLYRQMIDEHEDFIGWQFCEILADCRLPAEQKRESFLHGAASDDLAQARSALRQLRKFDEASFVQILVEKLDSFGAKRSGSHFWSTPEAGYTHLVILSGDQRVWDALLRAAKRAEVGLRLEYMSPMAYDHIGDKMREQRMTFLAEFLNDTDVRESPGSGPSAAFLWPAICVRDFAAMTLASILNLGNNPEPEWTEEQWSDLREEVKKALVEEGINLQGDD